MKGLFLIIATVLFMSTSYAGEMDVKSIDCSQIAGGTGINLEQGGSGSSTVTGIGGGSET